MRRKRAMNVWRKQTESLTGNTEPPPAQTCRPELSKLKSQRFRLLFTASQGSATSIALVKLGYKDKTTSCLSWGIKCLILDEKQTQNWILAASSQQTWGGHRIQYNYDLFPLTSQAIAALEREEWISCHSSCCRNVQAASCECPGS